MDDGLNPARSATVIGGGIVGLCIAHHLQQDGRRVTIFDPAPPGQGASYGNAGIVSVAGVLPLGMPGLLPKLPKMLLDPLAPLSIRWCYLPRIAPWLLQLLRASTPLRVEALSTALASLSVPSVDYYRPLLRAIGGEDLVKHTGCLYLYETPAEWRAARGETALRQRRGVKLELLGPDEIGQMVPALAPRFAGAVFVPDAAIAVNPLRLSQTIAAHFQQQGGAIVRERVTGFQLAADGPDHVITDKGRYPVEDLVIAAGAHSRSLVRQLGVDIPLDTERGYHAMLPDSGVDLTPALLIPNGGFAVTPMEHGLRVSGTVEFAGLGAAPNYARADALLRQAKRLFPHLNHAGAERWMGFRPSLPDSLPVISRSPRHRSVFFAFGHGHLGLTQGAVTGRLISDLVAGRQPDIDIAPFRIGRFRAHDRQRSAGLEGRSAFIRVDGSGRYAIHMTSGG